MRHYPTRLIVLLSIAALLAMGSVTPAVAAPRAKLPNKDGSIPARWNLPTPVIPSDDSTPSPMGGDGSGTNQLSFANFDDGDMVCAFPGGVLTGHAGIWKDALHTSLYSRCIWSANTSPVDGVQRETPIKYNGYDYAYGLWVPSRYAYGPSAVNWCAVQAGEPYDLFSPKTDYSSWYCSKLAWAGWKVRAGVDLDADGGFWVKPADLVNDS